MSGQDLVPIDHPICQASIAKSLTVRPGRDGRTAQLCKAVVQLQKGMHYNILGKETDDEKQNATSLKACLTVAGVTAINKIAGISVSLPESLFANGSLRGNPYVETDADGYVTRAWCRRIAYGRSPLGEPVAVDYTAMYDLRSYTARDVAKKIRYAKPTDDVGRLGLRGSPPQTTETSGPYKFYPVDGDMGFWFNLRHKDALAVSDTVLQRRTMAVTTVQSMAERNALAKHPAIGGLHFLVPKANERQCAFVVLYWREETPLERSAEIAEAFAQGKPVAGYRVLDLDPTPETDFVVDEEMLEQDDAEAAPPVDADRELPLRRKPGPVGQPVVTEAAPVVEEPTDPDNINFD